MENKKKKLATGFCQDADYKCTEANYTAASTTINTEDGEDCCCKNDCYEINQPEGVSVLNEAYEYAKDFIILSEQNNMFKPFMKELREAYLKGFKYMNDGGDYCNIDFSFGNVFYDNLRDVGGGFWAAYKTFIKNAFDAGVNLYVRYSEGKIKIFDIENVNDALVSKGDELSHMELWADRNVGANTHTDSGNYYTSGEAQNLGRIPIKEQFEELLKNCEYMLTTQNGVKGELFTSKLNGNSIFLPAAGYRSNLLNYDVSSSGYYWSSSALNDYAHYLYFYYDDVYMNFNDSSYGLSVRLVK